MTPSEFSTLSQTYIENWSPGLAALSIKQHRILLNNNELRALGQKNRCNSHWFAGESTPLDTVIQKLETGLKLFPEGAFVRLGSRSPKDSYQFLYRGGFVNKAELALQLLTTQSERIAYDLYFALRNHYAPSIYLREWQNIPRWAEFRCFMKNRQLVGISQYDCINLGHSPEIEQHHMKIKQAICDFFKNIKTQCLIDDVVFDVFVETEQDHLKAPVSVKLLELNPWFHKTDACLFDWNKPDDFDASFRYRLRDEN